MIVEFGMRPPARRGHRDLRPGGKWEGGMIGLRAESMVHGAEGGERVNAEVGMGNAELGRRNWEGGMIGLRAWGRGHRGAETSA